MSTSKIVSFFFDISNVTVLVSPQVNSFRDWLALRAFVLKPLPTAINLRVSFLIELANEGCPYSVPQINRDLRFIKSISRCCELRQEIRDLLLICVKMKNKYL